MPTPTPPATGGAGGGTLGASGSANPLLSRAPSRSSRAVSQHSDDLSRNAKQGTDEPMMVRGPEDWLRFGDVVTLSSFGLRRGALSAKGCRPLQDPCMSKLTADSIIIETVLRTVERSMPLAGCCHPGSITLSPMGSQEKLPPSAAESMFEIIPAPVTTALQALETYVANRHHTHTVTRGMVQSSISTGRVFGRAETREHFLEEIIAGTHFEKLHEESVMEMEGNERSLKAAHGHVVTYQDKIALRHVTSGYFLSATDVPVGENSFRVMLAPIPDVGSAIFVQPTASVEVMHHQPVTSSDVVHLNFLRFRAEQRHLGHLDSTDDAEMTHGEDKKKDRSPTTLATACAHTTPWMIKKISNLSEGVTAKAPGKRSLMSTDILQLRHTTKEFAISVDLEGSTCFEKISGPRVSTRRMWRVQSVNVFGGGVAPIIVGQPVWIQSLYTGGFLTEVEPSPFNFGAGHAQGGELYLSKDVGSPLAQWTFHHHVASADQDGFLPSTPFYIKNCSSGLIISFAEYSKIQRNLLMDGDGSDGEGAAVPPPPRCPFVPHTAPYSPLEGMTLMHEPPSVYVDLCTIRERKRVLVRCADLLHEAHAKDGYNPTTDAFSDESKKDDVSGFNHPHLKEVSTRLYDVLFETIVDIITSLSVSSDANPFTRAGAPVPHMQQICVDVGVPEVATRILEAVPASAITSPELSRFFLIGQLVYRLLIHMCKESLPCKKLLARRMDLFHSHLGTGIRALELMTEVYDDNTELLEKLDWDELSKIWTTKKKVIRMTRFLHFLKTVCKVNGAMNVKNQNLVAEFILGSSMPPASSLERESSFAIGSKTEFGSPRNVSFSQVNLAGLTPWKETSNQQQGPEPSVAHSVVETKESIAESATQAPLVAEPPPSPVSTSVAGPPTADGKEGEGTDANGSGVGEGGGSSLDVEESGASAPSLEIPPVPDEIKVPRRMTASLIATAHFLKSFVAVKNLRHPATINNSRQAPLLGLDDKGEFRMRLPEDPVDVSISVSAFHNKAYDLISLDENALPKDARMVGYLYHLITLFTEMCRGSNRYAIQRLASCPDLGMSYQGLLQYIMNTEIPLMIRSAMLELMVVMYIDREYLPSVEPVNHIFVWSKPGEEPAGDTANGSGGDWGSGTEGDGAGGGAPHHVPFCEIPEGMRPPENYSDLAQFIVEFYKANSKLSTKLEQRGQLMFLRTLTKAADALIDRGMFDKNGMTEGLTESLMLLLEREGDDEQVGTVFEREAFELLAKLKGEACLVIKKVFLNRDNIVLRNAFTIFCAMYFDLGLDVKEAESLRQLKDTDHTRMGDLNRAAIKAVQRFKQIASRLRVRVDAGAGEGNEPEEKSRNVLKRLREARDGGHAIKLRSVQKAVQALHRLQTSASGNMGPAWTDEYFEATTKGFVDAMEDFKVEVKQGLGTLLHLLGYNSFNLMVTSMQLIFRRVLVKTAFLIEVSQSKLITCSVVAKNYPKMKKHIQNIQKLSKWVHEADRYWIELAEEMEKLTELSAQGHRKISQALLTHFGVHETAMSLLERLGEEIRTGAADLGVLTKDIVERMERDCHQILRTLCEEMPENQELVFAGASRLSAAAESCKTDAGPGMVAETLRVAIENNESLAKHRAGKLNPMILELARTSRDPKFIRFMRAQLLQRNGAEVVVYGNNQDKVFATVTSNPEVMEIHGVPFITAIERNKEMLEGVTAHTMSRDILYLSELGHLLADCTLGAHSSTRLRCRTLVPITFLVSFFKSCMEMMAQNPAVATPRSPKGDVKAEPTAKKRTPSRSEGQSSLDPLRCYIAPFLRLLDTLYLQEEGVVIPMTLWWGNSFCDESKQQPTDIDGLDGSLMKMMTLEIDALAWRLRSTQQTSILFAGRLNSKGLVSDAGVAIHRNLVFDAILPALLSYFRRHFAHTTLNKSLGSSVVNHLQEGLLRLMGFGDGIMTLTEQESIIELSRALNDHDVENAKSYLHQIRLLYSPDVLRRDRGEGGYSVDAMWNKFLDNIAIKLGFPSRGAPLGDGFAVLAVGMRDPSQRETLKELTKQFKDNIDAIHPVAVRSTLSMLRCILYARGGIDLEKWGHFVNNSSLLKIFTTEEVREDQDWFLSIGVHELCLSILKPKQLPLNLVYSCQTLEHLMDGPCVKSQCAVAEYVKESGTSGFIAVLFDLLHSQTNVFETAMKEDRGGKTDEITFSLDPSRLPDPEVVKAILGTVSAMCCGANRDAQDTFSTIGRGGGSGDDEVDKGLISRLVGTAEVMIHTAPILLREYAGQFDILIKIMECILELIKDRNWGNRSQVVSAGAIGVIDIALSSIRSWGEGQMGPRTCKLRVACLDILQELCDGSEEMSSQNRDLLTKVNWFAILEECDSTFRGSGLGEKTRFSVRRKFRTYLSRMGLMKGSSLRALEGGGDGNEKVGLQSRRKSRKITPLPEDAVEMKELDGSKTDDFTKAADGREEGGPPVPGTDLMAHASRCFRLLMRAQGFEPMKESVSNKGSQCAVPNCQRQRRAGVDRFCLTHLFDRYASPAFLHFKKFHGTVEIIKDGVVERAIYEIPASFAPLVGDTRFWKHMYDYIVDIPRDNPKEKATLYLKRMAQGVLLAEHNLGMLNLRFTCLLLKYEGPITIVPYYLSMSLACLVIISYQDFEQNFAQPWENWKHEAFYSMAILMGIMHIILTALVMMWYVFTQIPKLIIDHEYKRGRLQIFSRTEPDSGIYKYHHRAGVSYARWALFLIRTPLSYYYFFFCLMSTLGTLVSPYFFAYHLADVYRFKAVQDSLKSITINLDKVVQVSVLGLIAIYLFVIVGFTFLQDQHPNEVCQTAFSCYMHYLVNWISPPDLFDDFDPPHSIFDDAELSAGGLFRIFFIAFSSLFYVGVLQGVIIDAFGQLREEHAIAENDLKSRCFICSTERFEIEQTGTPFVYHVRQQHNLENYMMFLLIINNKRHFDLTPIEKYVYTLYNGRTVDFLPIGRALCLDQDDIDRNEQQDKIAEFVKRLEKIEETMKDK